MSQPRAVWIHTRAFAFGDRDLRVADRAEVAALIGRSSWIQVANSQRHTRAIPVAIDALAGERVVGAPVGLELLRDRTRLLEVEARRLADGEYTDGRVVDVEIVD